MTDIAAIDTLEGEIREVTEEALLAFHPTHAHVTILEFKASITILGVFATI